MSSGIFRGLSDGNNSVNPYSKLFTQRNLVMGHVLDVVLDEYSPYYRSQASIGSIRFRPMPLQTEKSEELVAHIAYPADRTDYRVPLPGEQVICTQVVPSTQNGLSVYVYISVLTQNNSATYNSSPFLGTSPYSIDSNELNLQVDVANYAKRFEERLEIDVDYYKTLGGEAHMIEGDKVIQNRFGSSIKFTSTQIENNAPNANGPINQIVRPASTEDGDPLTILKVNKKTDSFTTQIAPNRDNIDTDDASVYLASSQTIDMRVFASKNMYTWSTTAKTGNVTRGKEYSQLAQSTLPKNPELLYDPERPFTLDVNATVVIESAPGATPPASSTQTTTQTTTPPATPPVTP